MANPAHVEFLTADGLSNGTVTVADSAPYVVGAVVFLGSTTQQTRRLEVVSKPTGTTVVVKVAGAGSNFDCSAYLSADGSRLSQPNSDQVWPTPGQPFSPIANQSISQSVNVDVGGGTSGTALNTPNKIHCGAIHFPDTTSMTTAPTGGNANLTDDTLTLSNDNAVGYAEITFNDNTDVWVASLGYGNASAGDAAYQSKLYWQHDKDILFVSSSEAKAVFKHTDSTNWAGVEMFRDESSNHAGAGDSISNLYVATTITGSDAFTRATGFEADAYGYGTGTLTELIGLGGYVETSGGTVNQIKSVVAYAPFVGGGTTQEAIGVFIESMEAPGSVKSFAIKYESAPGDPANGFVVRGENGRIGLGTYDPTEKLHVVGNAIVTGTLTVNGQNVTGGGGGGLTAGMKFQSGWGLAANTSIAAASNQVLAMFDLNPADFAMAGATTTFSVEGYHYPTPDIWAGAETLNFKVQVLSQDDFETWLDVGSAEVNETTANGPQGFEVSIEAGHIDSPFNSANMYRVVVTRTAGSGTNQLSWLKLNIEHTVD